MLKSKRFNMVLALIAAIALWAYVLGEINPESNTTVKNVPINFTNYAELEETGLTLLSSSDTSVNVSISGKRTDITKVEPSDFSVSADLEGLNKGEHTVRLNISGPDSVKIEHINIEKVKVAIDDLVTVEKEVEVVVNGQAGTDKEPDIVETNRDTVNVTGAKTLTDKVNKVRASVELSQIGGSMKTFNAALVPVDKDGVQVLGLRLNHSEVKITAVMLNKKTVNLEVPVINQDDGDVERNVSAPKTIVIKGTEEALKNISKIVCKTLDLSGVYENVSLNLSPILPEGVRVSDESAEISAKVTVKGLAKKTFEFTQEDIKLLNKDENLKYTIASAAFDVEVVGKESALNGLSASDFTISADVGKLGKGTHTVTVTVLCGKDISSATVSEERVEIIIE